jgi:Uma2 family endonuclease
LAKLQQKMTNNWLANGVQLAWLIDPYKEQVFVYRQGKEVECVKGFNQKLSGEQLLPGFELDLMEMRAKK